MMLNTQDPAELTRQLNTVGNVIDRETIVLDQLETARGAAHRPGGQVEAAKAEVEQQRRAAAENLVLRRQLETKAAEAEDAVTRTGPARRTAQDAAAGQARRRAHPAKTKSRRGGSHGCWPAARTTASTRATTGR